jgi:catechol 2,3-dioxygenase-like lactoylglutathione lyase family enzyme
MSGEPDARTAAQDAARAPDARVVPEAGPVQPAAKRDAAQPAQPMDAGRTPPTAAADSAPPAEPPPAAACSKRAVSGAAGVRFHHVHFNTLDPAQDIEFFDKYFGAKAEEFCRGEGAGKPTLATRTERGWFLYSKVASAPDPKLNTYLEHVGWIHPDPAAELQRLVELGAPRWPQVRAQCETAFNGTAPCNNYWFYLQAPSGARIEVARGPGPAAMGFGHVHMFMGIDYPFFETATGGAFKNKVIDMVNHTDAALQESVLTAEAVVETRGKPIDHIGYSTTDLEAEKARVMAAGLTLAEDISFKPEYGFRSFFMKSAKGVWIEMVEDSPFVPAP